MDLHSLDMLHDDPEDGRWEAFIRRDPGADGAFVVAVETTCIYCRPTCPARRPLRKNVRFLPDAATAERQGYRACKRCRPELAQRPAELLVEKVKSLLVADLEAPPGLDALARVTGISPAHLQKTFKKHTGVSPKEFVAAARLERWKAGLRAGRPVTEAWLEAGYGSAGRAYAAARKQMGMSPAQYGKGGAGQRITWTVLDTPLGGLLLARTDRGLCRVAFGESARALETLLRSEFPAAELERASPESDARLRAAAAALGERSGAERLPLDVEATGFQRQVWQALRTIPSGSTASYAEVARSVGHPKAVRAVARACATNPVALAVPCHRVVHSDGSLSGYRWGPERKRVLLAAERDAAGSDRA
ncbi:MAG TPA: bifunctional DNA-binding transcriptional regulator/O6-methylguanine-DNA methyltransferase Ada [Myxococcaceae bacterium]|nr:bifunctional DNA-binding transcriptional regulator/O6-methylguanine-DNA methyltransferase Ada [Myxococcaceae bacterium]